MQLHKLQIRPRICITTNSWAIRLTVDYNQRGHPTKFLPKESSAVQTLDRIRAT